MVPLRFSGGCDGKDRFGTMSFQMVPLPLPQRRSCPPCFGTMSFQMVPLRAPETVAHILSFGTMSFQMVPLPPPSGFRLQWSFGTMSFQMVPLLPGSAGRMGQSFGTMSFQMVPLHGSGIFCFIRRFGTMSFQMVPLPYFIKPQNKKNRSFRIRLQAGAGDGNRTHVTSLEGWGSTIELHPHINWSGRRGSDPRPPPWQGGALPTELLPHIPHPTTGTNKEKCAGEET